MSRSWLIALALLLYGAEAPCADEPTELDPITVTRPAPNPLDESRERLRRMMKDAPDGGSAVPFRQDWTETVATWFVPHEMTVEQRRDARVANDWRIAERGPEMDAFR